MSITYTLLHIHRPHHVLQSLLLLKSNGLPLLNQRKPSAGRNSKNRHHRRMTTSFRYPSRPQILRNSRFLPGAWFTY